MANRFVRLGDPERPPGGKPIPGRTNLEDVEWALTKARRFIFRGGDPADVEAYVNVWLDYRATLRGTPLEHVGGKLLTAEHRSLKPSGPPSEEPA